MHGLMDYQVSGLVGVGLETDHVKMQYFAKMLDCVGFHPFQSGTKSTFIALRHC